MCVNVCLCPVVHCLVYWLGCKFIFIHKSFLLSLLPSACCCCHKVSHKISGKPTTLDASDPASPWKCCASWNLWKANRCYAVTSALKSDSAKRADDAVTGLWIWPSGRSLLKTACSHWYTWENYLWSRLLHLQCEQESYCWSYLPAAIRLYKALNKTHPVLCTIATWRNTVLFKICPSQIVILGFKGKYAASLRFLVTGFNIILGYNNERMNCTRVDEVNKRSRGGIIGEQKRTWLTGGTQGADNCNDKCFVSANQVWKKKKNQKTKWIEKNVTIYNLMLLKLRRIYFQLRVADSKQGFVFSFICVFSVWEGIVMRWDYVV